MEMLTGKAGFEPPYKLLQDARPVSHMSCALIGQSDYPNIFHHKVSVCADTEMNISDQRRFLNQAVKMYLNTVKKNKKKKRPVFGLRWTWFLFFLQPVSCRLALLHKATFCCSLVEIQQFSAHVQLCTHDISL